MSETEPLNEESAQGQKELTGASFFNRFIARTIDFILVVALYEIIPAVGYFAGLVWAANIVLSNPDIRYGSCKATFLRDAIASTAALFSAGMAAAIAGGAGASVGVALVGLVAGAISAVNIYVSECLSGTAGSA